MSVEKRILDAIEGDIRCGACGRFVKIGEGKTLGYWSERGNFCLICSLCEHNESTMNVVNQYKQGRV